MFLPSAAFPSSSSSSCSSAGPVDSGAGSVPVLTGSLDPAASSTAVPRLTSFSCRHCHAVFTQRSPPSFCPACGQSLHLVAVQPPAASGQRTLLQFFSSARSPPAGPDAVSSASSSSSACSPAVLAHWVSVLAQEERSSGYVVSAGAEMSRLLAWLPARPDGLPRSVFDVTPILARDFLLYRIVTGGRTVVHGLDCEFTGDPDHKSCGCPIQLKFSSARVLNEKLKSGFSSVDLCGDANPSASPLVMGLLRQVTKYQLRRGVMEAPSQPLLADKARLLSAGLLRLAACPPSGFSVADCLQLRQDRAWLCFAFSSALRHGQLGSTRIHSLIRVDPSDPLSDLIGNYAWGKTLRSGTRHPVRISRLPSDEVLCPVRAVSQWFRAARATGWDMSKGYLFSPILPDGVRSLHPGSAPDMHRRFKGHLARFSTDDGETLHGTRGGAALNLLQSGSSPAQVASHVGWSASASSRGGARSSIAPMLQHYTSVSRIEALAGAPISSLSVADVRRLQEISSLPAHSRSRYLL